MSVNSTATSRVSPPISVPRSMAALATSEPTWRPNSSRISSRSRSPPAMRLKPDCISPSSLPSNTGTSASKSPSSTRFSASRTETTGSEIPRAACQVMSSPMASDTPPSTAL